MSIGVGFCLQPEESYLELLAPVLLEEPDYFEVAPETTWRPGASGEWVANGYAQRFLELGRAANKPFVAHGVGLSLGSARPDRDRRKQWLARIAQDMQTFEYLWYTDHLGTTTLGTSELQLPLPTPMTSESATLYRSGLLELQQLVPHVGLENTANYCHVGDPLDEGRFLGECLDAPGMHLVLDLHNAWTTALNAGLDVHEYLASMPFERVIELHISGGAWSDPTWLRSRRELRLDSHDGAVPEEVWSLLDTYLPRCTNLRGVTLERMEGSVTPADVGILRGELHRLRKTLEWNRV